jgi:phenol hydroxylase P4 protein
MSVVSLKPGYTGKVADAEENFHGARLLNIHWEGHLNYCAALCFPLPPDLPFGALISDVVGPIYGLDSDWAGIDWAQVRWTLDGAPFTPDFEKSLGVQGFVHKSLLRFWTKAEREAA